MDGIVQGRGLRGGCRHTGRAVERQHPPSGLHTYSPLSARCLEAPPPPALATLHTPWMYREETAHTSLHAAAATDGHPQHTTWGSGSTCPPSPGRACRRHLAADACPSRRHCRRTTIGTPRPNSPPPPPTGRLSPLCLSSASQRARQLQPPAPLSTPAPRPPSHPAHHSVAGTALYGPPTCGARAGACFPTRPHQAFAPPLHACHGAVKLPTPPRGTRRAHPSPYNVRNRVASTYSQRVLNAACTVPPHRHHPPLHCPGVHGRGRQHQRPPPPPPADGAPRAPRPADRALPPASRPRTTREPPASCALHPPAVPRVGKPRGVARSARAGRRPPRVPAVPPPCRRWPWTRRPF